MKKQMLITVGTTKFENLIKAIDRSEFYNLLDKNGFTDLVIQKGIGEYEPNEYKNINFNNLKITVGKLFNNFEEVIRQSEIVISHGGAGIILESLKNGKKLIVVVNDTLMDNHQTELAETLVKDGYAYFCKDLGKVTEFVDDILVGKSKELNVYPQFNLDAIPNVIYEMLDI
jgi:beta-1,4-N-acetylglucosaminyltransferase